MTKKPSHLFAAERAILNMNEFQCFSKSILFCDFRCRLRQNLLFYIQSAGRIAPYVKDNERKASKNATNITEMYLVYAMK